MTLCTDTETAIVEAIDGATREAFQLMAGIELERTRSGCEVDSQNPSQQDSAITVVMGLTGGLQGSLSIAMYGKSALKWTECLIGAPVNETDQNVIDAVGELGNVIVGGAKRTLTQFDLTMSLPSVFRAQPDQVRLPNAVVPIRMSYEFDGNELEIFVSLRRES